VPSLSNFPRGFMGLPCFLDRHQRIRSERHQFFSLVVNIRPSPQLSATRSDPQIQTAAIAECIGLLARFCGLHLNVSQPVELRHKSTPSRKEKNTPSCTPLQARLWPDGAKRTRTVYSLFSVFNVKWRPGANDCEQLRKGFWRRDIEETCETNRVELRQV
jgi:hypothetical protein